MLELFHGPTLAFKDVALQFLGHLFESVLARSEAALNIVAATSGDTGSAAIQGLRSRRGLRLFVLHPHGRVSPIQALQMTTVLDANVHNLAIEGTFDDSRTSSSALSDLASATATSRAINSINWARCIARWSLLLRGFRVMERTGADRRASVSDRQLRRHLRGATSPGAWVCPPRA